MIRRDSSPREGYVLIAVLIVVAVLALVSYRFTDAMTTEYRAAVRTADMAKLRAGALAGIHYTAASLADPNTVNGTLGGNITNNASAFSNLTISTDSKYPNKQVRVSIISVTPTGTQGSYQQQYGVINEGSKLNINSWIAIDPSGTALYNALMLLPNMTAQTASNIVAWVTPANTSPPSNAPAGMQSAYYETLTPSYQAKNGPLNSLEELLLVQGVTPQLLFGNDQNRNGLPDDSNGQSVDRGWSDYLTVHGRELNVDSTGNFRINVNGDDLNAIYSALQSAGIDKGTAAYIIGAKLYGTIPYPLPSIVVSVAGNTTNGGNNNNGNNNGNNSSGSKGGSSKGSGGTTSKSGGSSGGGTKGGSSGGTKGGTSGGATPPPATGGIQTKVGTIDELIAEVEASLQNASSSGKTIPSVLGLANSQINLPVKRAADGTQTQTIVYSPLNDTTTLTNLLPTLMDKLTTTSNVELSPRIDVATAPAQVLQSIPGLTLSDVDTIVAAQSGLTPGDPATTSGAWLVTAANLPIAKYQLIQKYVTGSSMVYRIHAVAYFTGGGPMVRMEAVVDTNLGAPRILSLRDLTAIDNPRGFPMQPQPQH